MLSGNNQYIYAFYSKFYNFPTIFIGNIITGANMFKFVDGSSVNCLAITFEQTP